MRPLVGPASWHGVTFAAFRSRAQADAIRTLGAHTSEAWSDALASGIKNGRIEGFEKNLLVYRISGLAEVAPYVTANVNLWPQTTALVANPRRLEGLTRAQQSWLRLAAVDAAARSTRLADHDAGLVAALCRAGARFATASADELAALQQAVAPVYAKLDQDPQTRAFIARIEQLKQSTPSGPALTIPPSCSVGS
jgi:TRAP-type C4-dicarboxylate transport system substrate-binding protein